MERFLRDWRQDALNKAQYDSAIFIGDKLLAMTSTTTTLGISPHLPPTLSLLADDPSHHFHLTQKMITTPFGLPKFTSPPATTRAPTTSSRNTT